MAAMERLRILRIFKQLHRTSQIVFKNDATALTAARARINLGFTENKSIKEEKKLEELVVLAEQSEEYLRKCVVQAEYDETGKKHVVKLRDGLAYQENVPYEGPTCKNS